MDLEGVQWVRSARQRNILNDLSVESQQENTVMDQGTDWWLPGVQGNRERGSKVKRKI